MMRYSLIIPIFNEDSTIRSLIEGLKYLKPKIEIIFINDGSSDNSFKILSEYQDIVLINNDINIGKGASILKAIDVAQGDYIILFDGDLEIKPDQIKKLINLHNGKLHIIFKGKRKPRTNFSIFELGNKVLNFTFNKIYKSSFQDIFCCLIVIKKEMFSSFKLNSKRFSIETEIMANIALNELPFEEINVEYKRREYFDGKKLNFFDVFDILKVMFKKKYF
jgi:glycosyltransferase involved in cell wall biosynthesis